MSERSKEHASKACEGATPPWVQIPPPPPVALPLGLLRPGASLARLVVVAAAALSLAAPATARAAATATNAQWSHVAHCESGGDWHLNSGNGYFGGLQLSAATWASFGGHQYARRADLASRAEQIDVGNRIFAVDGWKPWPTCAPGSVRRSDRHH